MRSLRWQLRQWLGFLTTRSCVVWQNSVVSVDALRSMAKWYLRAPDGSVRDHYRLIDDYGHHPHEMAATLQALRGA